MLVKRTGGQSAHVADWHWWMWKRTRIYCWYVLHVEEYVRSRESYWEDV